MTPQEGDHLTVSTTSGTRNVRVQDVTNIGAGRHADGRRLERFSVILEGADEFVLENDAYDFESGEQRFPMDVRTIGPDDGGPQLYEALLEVDDPSSI